MERRRAHNEIRVRKRWLMLRKRTYYRATSQSKLRTSVTQCRVNDAMTRIRNEYLKCRTRLKITDTLAAGVAIINGAIAYIEVSLYFDYPI